MSTVDRIGRLEGAQTLTENMLAWLERVHAWPNLNALVQAEAHGGESDIIRLLRDVAQMLAEQPVSVEERDRVRRRMYAEALFLRYLAFGLELAALRSADRLGPRLVIVQAAEHWSSAEPVPVEVPSAIRPEPPPTGTSTQTIPEMAERLLACVEVEEQARSLIEARYYSGRSVLFEDTASKWTGLQSMVEGIRLVYEIPDGPDRRRSIAVRARARATELFDDARMNTFEHVGLDDLARRIATWQLVGGRPERGRLSESPRGMRGLRLFSVPLSTIEEFLDAPGATVQPERQQPTETS